MRAAPLLALAFFAIAAGPLAAKVPSQAERTKAFAKLPNWNGFWLTENDETSIGGLPQAAVEPAADGQPRARAQMALFGFAAPWNEAGQQRQAAARKAGVGQKAQGWGFPVMMNAAAPVQFLITPEEVLVVNAYRDVRHIYTDGRKHPAPDDLWPTVWGDSIGHWEGDTLVVDTIAVRNPNAYFHGAPPLSDDAHYVERIRMTGPNRLEDDFVIEDPATLSKPWIAKVVYQPAEGFDRMVSIDFDNDRTGLDAAGVNTIEPSKDGK